MRSISTSQFGCKGCEIARSNFMASHTIPDPIDMNSNAKTWLQLYVDAMTEKDPYKRLALVEELRKMPPTHPPRCKGRRAGHSTNQAGQSYAPPPLSCFPA